MKVRARKKVDATFNMSSMTDIVFLLLIFFIVLSTLVTRGVDVDLPKAEAGPVGESTTVNVGINKEGVYSVDGSSMDYEAVLNSLKSKVSSDEYPSVILTADGSVPLEDGIALFADIKNLGYTKIVIATQPKNGN